MRVGLLLKHNKPEAVEIARQLCRQLVARGIVPLVVGDHVGEEAGARSVEEAHLGAQIDLLLVLGGDGTLLHGAELVADHRVPILGVNLGTLGFLTSCPPEHARETLELALDGKLPIESRMRLRVVLRQKGGAEVARFACNDAVISQGALARLLEFDAFLDGQSVTKYRADGIIIATPTGSTAYTLAAGGPILTPDLEAMVVTPICPHTLTNRPLVVPASSRLTLRLGAEAQNVVLTVDGQWGHAFSPEDSVEIHAANRPMLLCRPPNITYFDILRTKLHWGERNR